MGKERLPLFLQPAPGAAVVSSPWRLIAVLADLLNQAGDGNGIGDGDDGHLAAVTFHHFPAFDRSGGVVAAFGKDLGSESPEDIGELF